MLAIGKVEIKCGVYCRLCILTYSIPMNVSVGDTVVFGQYGGNEIKLNDEEYLILGEGDIFGVIE